MPLQIAALGWQKLFVCVREIQKTRVTQADAALRSVRVPRPSASSFTYRSAVPRRPAFAYVVGMPIT